jgi:predicted site-specific integrase-resolvase
LPDLAPLQELATEFKVSRTTIYKYIRAGRLTTYSKGMDRRTYLDRTQLRRLMRPKARPTKD